MNVLPFIIVIIALFASLGMSLFSHNRLLSFTEQSYAKFMDIDRMARKKGIESLYSKLPKEVSVTKEKTKQQQEKQEVTPLRLKPQYAQNARINVHSILFADDPSPLFFSDVKDLCSAMYSSLPEYQKLIKDKKLDAFFSELRKSAKTCKASQFTEIELSKYQELYYKMCRGTQYYDVAQGKGYPPLDDLLRIEEKGSNKPIRWRILPPYILKHFLEPELCEKILDAERGINKEGRQFSKKDLDELIGQEPMLASSYENILPFLDHNCGRLGAKTIAAKDDQAFTKVEKSFIVIPGQEREPEEESQ